MGKERIGKIQKRFQLGEYAISNHAIIEARKDGMSLLKKRLCPECHGEMNSQLINMLYKKEHSELQIYVYWRLLL